MDNLKGDEEKKERGMYYETPPNKLECAVCLQICVQPVQLPCRHIFCYLCVKGVTNQSKRCAMCRQEIPIDYLDNPFLLANEESDVSYEGGYQWFYEGRNGWWQYDERTSSEIETSYKRGDKQCEVLIAGFLYVIDYQKCIQVRRCDPFRRRRIKRDLSSIPKKGVAGIRAVAIHNSSDEVSVVQDGNDTPLDASKMAVQYPCGWSERDFSPETLDSAISVNCDTESCPHSDSEPLSSSFSGITVSDSEKSVNDEKRDSLSDTSRFSEYAEASFSEENDSIFRQ